MKRVRGHGSGNRAAATKKRTKSDYFSARPVVLLLDGKVVERYPSLKDFHEANCTCNLSTTCKRLSRCADGWLPDGLVARYEGDEDKEGVMLVSVKARQRGRKTDPHSKASMADELAESEAKIERLYDEWRRGEITVYERNEQVAWLENHVKVLRERIKNKRKEDM